MSARINWLLVGSGIVIVLGWGCGKPQPAAGGIDRADPPTTNRAAMVTIAADPAGIWTAPPVAGGSADAPEFIWSPEPGSTMEVAQAVMVTAELDFGTNIPKIAEALTAVDRRYQSDGGERTFAILDAYGEPTADGKLHISMHVSSEQPGRGALVFRRTGQILWDARIQPAAHPTQAEFTGTRLDIMIADEQGAEHLLDGSGGGESILDVPVRDQGVKLREFWPDGAERQLTFFYSACGCPVKVLCRRQGERTPRTKDLPVIFPDDPEVVAVINHLLGWSEL